MADYAQARLAAMNAQYEAALRAGGMGQMEMYAARNELARARLGMEAAQARRAAAIREKAARDALAAQQFNAAGNAFSLHTIASRGVGTIDVTTPVTFQVTFVTEPFFLTGAALVNKPRPQNGAAVGTPAASATVRGWMRDGAGAYTGALIALHVSPPDAGENAPVLESGDYAMTHYLQFQGTAYKDLGQDNTAKLHELGARIPGFGDVRWGRAD